MGPGSPSPRGVCVFNTAGGAPCGRRRGEPGRSQFPASPLAAERPRRRGEALAARPPIHPSTSLPPFFPPSLHPPIHPSIRPLTHPPPPALHGPARPALSAGRQRPAAPGCRDERRGGGVLGLAPKVASGEEVTEIRKSQPTPSHPYPGPGKAGIHLPRLHPRSPAVSPGAPAAASPGTAEARRGGVSLVRAGNERSWLPAARGRRVGASRSPPTCSLPRDGRVGGDGHGWSGHSALGPLWLRPAVAGLTRDLRRSQPRL